MHNIVFLNGKFIKQEEARVSVLTPAFLYGWGLFETMRSYNKHIVYFSQHLKRIKNSCLLLNMRFPDSLVQIKYMIKKLVTINGLKDAHVRLTVGKSDPGTDVLITATRYLPYSVKKYRQGFSAQISSFRQSENSHLAKLKTTNYLLYKLAFIEAKEKGFDEAIILNERGYIAEGSRSNIFLIKDNQIFTPALECGCLDGVTRKVVFDLGKKYNIKISEGNLTIQNLLEADAAFFTNSLMGIMPLVSLEKRNIRKHLSHKLTKFLMKQYNLLLQHETKKNKFAF